MANTSSRALRLLSLLQNHRFWPGAELAERLGVSSRTLRRDIDRLRELGYPVTAHPGVDGGYQLAPGAALPPLVLDDEEAVALAVGLRLATQGAAQGTVAASDAAPGGPRRRRRRRPTPSRKPRPARWRRSPRSCPARLRRRAGAVAAMTESASWDTARAGQAAAINPDVLATAALACRDSERIRFAYGAASGERTERHVEPHRLVALDRRWYLVAYDLTRNDWRSFRLDRVLGVPQQTGARFRPRALPAADAAEFVRRNVTAAPGAWRVEAVVEAPAAVVRERLGRWAAVTGSGPARCTVTIDERGEPRLGGDRARRDWRGLPGAVSAGAGRAGRRLGRPAHPGRPGAAGG